MFKVEFDTLTHRGIVTWLLVLRPVSDDAIPPVFDEDAVDSDDIERDIIVEHPAIYPLGHSTSFPTKKEALEAFNKLNFISQEEAQKEAEEDERHDEYAANNTPIEDVR